MRHRMSAAVSVLAAGALVLAACSSADDSTNESSASTPAGQSSETSESQAGAKPFEGQTLTVLNYKGFGSDEDYAIKGFEELTGAKVEHVYHSGAEELRRILRTGGIGNIDVLQPNTTFVQQLASEGLIDPIDESKIPNLSKASPDFVANENLHYDGKLYAAPVVWGTTPMFFKTSAGDVPTDWSALWDPKYKGRVSIRDNAENAITIAALYLGQDPYHPDLDTVEDALMELRPQIVNFWTSEDDITRSASTDLIDVGYAWDSTIAGIAREGYDYQLVVPEGGVIGWLDGWAIAHDSPHPDLAHAWINWMISTEFQTEWLNDPEGSAPASANQEVKANLTEDALSRLPALDIDPSKVLVGASIEPDVQQQYQDLWERVKAHS